MGSLFTLLLPILLFLRRSKRLWLAAGFSYVAFCVWGLTSANDRYLLAFLDIPIAFAAAALVRGWSLGKFAQLGLIPLVAIQFLWAVDAPLKHSEKSIRHAVTMMKKGYTSRGHETRFNHRARERSLNEQFPEDSVILGRYFKSLMGLDRTTLNTHPQIQTYVDFRKLKNPRDLWQICRDRGITHLLYPEGRRRPEYARNLILFDALVYQSKKRKKFSRHMIAEISIQPPSTPENYEVLLRGYRGYQDGLHRVSALSRRDRHTKKGPSRKALVPYSSRKLTFLYARADAVLHGNRRPKAKEVNLLNKTFKRVERFGKISVWLKRKQIVPELTIVKRKPQRR